MVTNRDDDVARPLPSSRACPHCLNDNTIVVDVRVDALVRLCPMCDYSWVVREESSEKDAAPKRGVGKGE